MKTNHSFFIGFAVICIVAIGISGCGGNDPKRLGKEMYDLAQDIEKYTAELDLEKLESLEERFEKLQWKVDRLPEKEQAKVLAEFARLSGAGKANDTPQSSGGGGTSGSAPESDEAATNPGSIIRTSLGNFTVIPFERTSFFVDSNGDSLNVREIPGGAILFKLNHGDDVDVLAVTQEYATMDGRQDRWVKVRSKGGQQVGWVFGGFLGIERSGPKYPGVDPDDPYDDGV